MLNWAARYFPIVRALKPELPVGASVLEVGSGPFGIGRFLGGSFVGCDIAFPVRPNHFMRPVVASATELPFGDKSFDAVVLSDVLEHVPGDLRLCVVREGLRVMRRVAIFGFPSGSEALEYDLKLAEEYTRRGRERPEWLEEHMQYQPFPTKELFGALPNEWDVSGFDNENVVFHNWVMRSEMRRLGLYSFGFLLAFLPCLTEYLLQYADRPPCYRKIMVVRRRS
jgi:hypothetical protein